MKRVLVIDNYDSFVYNLVHYIEEYNVETVVWRNDEIDLQRADEFENILLSPGPGIPAEAGQMPGLIKKFAHTKRILGICLGHQAIAEYFGASLSNLNQVFHGVATNATIIKEDYLFKGLPKEIKVGRYHSWVVDNPLPTDLITTVEDDENRIMAIKHKTLDIKGIQFHPESVLTPLGKEIIANWIHQK